MYIASWSGGKDSCFACYLAMKKGMGVSHLVHFDRPNNLHGVDPAMILLQAKLAGIPITQKRVASQDFEREFKETVGDLAQHGAKGMIFGDIYLEPHKEWVDRVCGELGIDPIEPLWGMKTEDIIEGFLKAGFETIVASGDQRLIDRKYIGRKMDGEFIEYLKSRNLDVCGESGEFHTFVTSGPLFKGKIVINDSEIVSRDGFWFLNVRAYDVVNR
ncbi:MAG TPA: diphthine--ammonia ligase [Nitrospirota bacterium]